MLILQVLILQVLGLRVLGLRVLGPDRRGRKRRPRLQWGMLFFDQFDSQVGVIGVLGGPAGVRSSGWRLEPAGASIEPDETIQQVIGQLREYFAGQRKDFDVELDLPPMEPNTVAVLNAMKTIAYGETVTYAELARRSGTGLPPRAIGSMMAANPVPLIIPCHRVVAADGLGGYSGGEPGQELTTKRWLLENEGALPPTLVEVGF